MGASEPAIGEVVEGRFQIQRRLGGGAFSTVWLAVDLTSRSEVALKIMRPFVSESDRRRTRCIREAAILISLDHPNIGKATHFGEVNGTFYLALEYLKGETLDAQIRRRSVVEGHFSLSEVAWLMSEICSGVAFAHAHGIVHRDLKTSNIMVTTSPCLVKVIDFNIAKLLSDAPSESTTVGRFLGSILHLAPEQITSESIDVMSDVFTLGVVLYELLTLRNPWLRDHSDRPAMVLHAVPDEAVNGRSAILERIVRGPRPRPTRARPELPLAIDEVVERALSPSPKERFESVEALSSAILDVLGPAERPTSSESQIFVPTVPEAPTPLEPSEPMRARPQIDIIQRRPNAGRIALVFGSLVAVAFTMTTLYLGPSVDPQPARIEPREIEAHPVASPARAQPVVADPIGADAPSSDPPKPRRPLRARPKSTAAAEAPMPSSKAEGAVTEIDRVLLLLQDHPKDATLIRKLSQLILSGAERMGDEELKASIKRRAILGAAAGDVPGLLACVADLKVGASMPSGANAAIGP